MVVIDKVKGSEIEDEALEIKIAPDRSCFVVAMSSGVIRSSTGSDSSGYVRLWNCFAGTGAKSLIFEWYESAIPCEFNKVSDENPEPNEILCISLATDDSRFVTGGTDTVIKVAKTGLKRHCNYHTSRITALRYHPRGEFDVAYSHIFVSASWDNSVQIWDDRNPGSLWYSDLVTLIFRQYYGPHVAGSDGLDVEASQNLILTSSWTRSSVLLQGYVAKFGISGNLVFFTGSNTNILRIIDMENMATIAGVNNLPNAVYSLDTCFDRVDKRKCMDARVNTLMFISRANHEVTRPVMAYISY
ncbi:unnamed protein product [Dibothriocephalus latus]|uniref:Peroxin-7 n=1 Tax=Dibothriocephalus latus TaxID=60516 RepID=A0A3P7LTQ0_DIBLA|nr:unnamed protein product [Dibothriocephalus latus]